MSGIAGIIHFDGKPVELGLIEKMTGAMAHRGPDGIHHWVKGSVALGQCMLRTTPESLEEHQPLTNEDESLVLVMDGRVDNWEELRRELLARGAVLRSRSDAELVLRAYEIWGKECLAQIDGDFALVIWDARRREVFCARDRMGHKPLYFWRSGQGLAFGSEPSAILSLPWVEARMNIAMVAEFLTQEFLSASETLWSGLERLPPAMCMRIGRDAVFKEIYWSPGCVTELAYANDDEYIDHYRYLLFDQVRRSARSCRPIAAEVSGGLDSTAVYAVCKHLHSNGALTVPEVLGYTFDMSDEPDFDDTDYVAAVEAFVAGKIHHMKPFIDSLDGYRNRAAKTMCFPGFPNGIMHMSIYGHARSSGCAALLTGLGGDEWLGGTRSYFSEEILSGRFGILISLFKQEVQAFGFLAALQVALGDLARAVLPSRVRAALRQVIGQHRSAPQQTPLGLSNALMSLHETRKSLAHSVSKGPDYSSRDKKRMHDYYLHPFRTFALEQTELFGALSGIEIRHPLDSAAMLGFAMACPVRLRRRNSLDRYMHRKAMTDWLPPAVLKRRSKASFDFVFRRSLESLSRERLPPKAVLKWLNLQPEDLYPLGKGANSVQGLCWKDWSEWGLFACSAIRSAAEEQPPVHNAPSGANYHRYRGEIA